MAIKEIPVNKLIYKWQEILSLLAISKDHEALLSSYEYRVGLNNGGNTTLFSLYHSIKDEGLKHPLNVGPADADGYHRVILGNQRLACVRSLGYTEVPCEVAE